MSNKTAHPTSQQIPINWTQFISQTLGPIDQPWGKFPKKQLLAFLQSSKCPKIRQLLDILMIIYIKYQHNCEYFREIVILLYLLLIKGCINTSTEFISVSMHVLEDLLRYRLIIVCSSTINNCIVAVYSYMQQWLSLLVPAMLMYEANTKQKNKKPQKSYQQKNKQVKIKYLIQILKSLNKKVQQKRREVQTSVSVIDPLLILFESMLVLNMRNHLTHSSLYQFDSIMRRMYSYSAEKYQIVYQGKGCVSHITNKQKQKTQKQRQLMGCSIIRISELIPARCNQLSWQVYDLQLQLPNTQFTRLQTQSILKLKKVNSESQMQQWVSEAFKLNTQPTHIKLNFNSLINRMKAQQIYKFLCLLQIYGSSPNIEVLNQYITDQRILQFFTKFLLGQNLIQAALQLGQFKQNDRNILDKLNYGFKNQKFNKILQMCMRQVAKLQIRQQRQLFFHQFHTKVQNINYQKSNHFSVNKKIINTSECTETLQNRVNNKK